MRKHLITRRLMIQPVRRCLTAFGLAGLLVVLSSAAGRAAGVNSVVPPGGKVAGHGYDYWMHVKWQVFFAGHGPDPDVCGTNHSASEPVAVLFGIGDTQATCDEPVGRPIYVVGISNECSTLPGDHEGFGTTAEQLELCARAGFDGLSGTATVDGRPVADYPALIAATAVFGIQLAKDNPFGQPPLAAKSAAYGEGLLLHGLSAGTHRIRITSSPPGATYVAEYTVNVH